MTKQTSNYSQSVYAPAPEADRIKTHTLSILVENQPGALSKIIGFFTGRGYNIDALSVAETDQNSSLSRTIITTSGADIVLELIKAQLESLIQVRSVKDLTVSGPFIAREVALAKFSLTALSDGDRTALEDAADDFEARVISKTQKVIVFECVNTAEQIEKFVTRMRRFSPLGISRSGIAAVPSGSAPSR